MRKQELVVIALAIVFACPAMAESPLVMMDGSGAIIGEVISTDQNLTSAQVLYRLDTGGFAIWKVTEGNYEDPFVFTYFDLADCIGSKLLEITPTPIPMVTYFHRMTWLPGVVPIVIVRYPTASAGSSMTTRSYYHPTSGCVNTGAVTRNVVAEEFVENLRYYTGPIHIELNPVLFSDSFQTGDMGRWSNY